jgi:hypothetical protein
MKTLSVFGNLASIDSSNRLTAYKGVGYSVVIAGMYFSLRTLAHTFEASGVCFSYVFFLISGNSQLSDLYHVLDIQSSSTLGTYVGSNPLLCFNVPQLWARRNDSYLEHSLESVSFFCCTCVLVVFN